MALAALTPEERQQLILSVGTHRGERHLSPIEVARLLDRATLAGDTPEVLARAVSFDGTSQIGRLRALLKLPSDVQHLIDWGRSGDSLASTAAFELSRLSNPDDQREATRAILEHSLNTSEVRQLVQARKRSGKLMGECVQVVLKMRPQIEVRHVFIGAVLDADVRSCLNRLSQYGRDQLLRKILAESIPAAQAGGRLGSDRFTLVGGDALGSVVKSQKGRLEAEINRQLEIGVRSI